MLGARIDVLEAPIWHFNAYLLPLPDKKITSVVKREKMSGLDRNHHQTWSRLQRTLIRKGSLKYSLLLLWAHLKIFFTSRICCIWNNVWVHVCKTTNWRFICLINFNCINIFVINCGWNNIVAVKKCACWNWYIYIYIYIYGVSPVIVKKTHTKTL